MLPSCLRTKSIQFSGSGSDLIGRPSQAAPVICRLREADLDFPHVGAFHGVHSGEIAVRADDEHNAAQCLPASSIFLTVTLPTHVPIKYAYLSRFFEDNLVFTSILILVHMST